MGEKITTIQLRERTRRMLEARKRHERESYDSVLARLLEEDVPSMEEMFAECDSIQQDKTYSKAKIVDMTHELRGKG